MADPWAAFRVAPSEAVDGGGEPTNVPPIDDPWSKFRSAPPADRGSPGAPKTVLTVQPQKPDRGVTDAAARGVASGVTANFSDEIRGLVEASGANPDDPASVYKLLSGALKYWAGDAKAKESYDT